MHVGLTSDIKRIFPHGPTCTKQSRGKSYEDMYDSTVPLNQECHPLVWLSLGLCSEINAE